MFNCLSLFEIGFWVLNDLLCFFQDVFDKCGCEFVDKLRFCSRYAVFVDVFELCGVFGSLLEFGSEASCREVGYGFLRIKFCVVLKQEMVIIGKICEFTIQRVEVVWGWEDGLFEVRGLEIELAGGGYFLE